MIRIPIDEIETAAKMAAMLYKQNLVFTMVQDNGDWLIDITGY